MPKIPAGQKPAPRGGGGRSAGRQKPEAAAAPARRRKGKARVSQKALTEFTTQLSTLQDAGLPIVRSLKILEGQMDKGPFKGVLADVTEDVESGSPLSEALRQMVIEEVSSDAIREQALREGMGVLREAGLRAIFNGITTVEEVLRETAS